jgi:hypothetical protein
MNLLPSETFHLEILPSIIVGDIGGIRNSDIFDIGKDECGPNDFVAKIDFVHKETHLLNDMSAYLSSLSV